MAFAVAGYDTGYDIGFLTATMIGTLGPVRIDFVALCVQMACIVFGLSALMTLRWLPVGAVNRTNEPTLSVSSTSNVLRMGLRDLGIVAALTIGGLVLEMPTYNDVHLENLRFKLPMYVYGKAVSEDEAQVPLGKDPAGPFEARAKGLEHFFILYQSVGPIIWKTEAGSFFDGDGIVVRVLPGSDPFSQLDMVVQRLHDQHGQEGNIRYFAVERPQPIKGPGYKGRQWEASLGFIRHWLLAVETGTAGYIFHFCQLCQFQPTVQSLVREAQPELEPSLATDNFNPIVQKIFRSIQISPNLLKPPQPSGGLN